MRIISLVEFAVSFASQKCFDLIKLSNLGEQGLFNTQEQEQSAYFRLISCIYVFLKQRKCTFFSEIKQWSQKLLDRVASMWEQWYQQFIKTAQYLPSQATFKLAKIKYLQNIEVFKKIFETDFKNEGLILSQTEKLYSLEQNFNQVDPCPSKAEHLGKKLIMLISSLPHQKQESQLMDISDDSSLSEQEDSMLAQTTAFQSQIQDNSWSQSNKIWQSQFCLGQFNNFQLGFSENNHFLSKRQDEEVSMTEIKQHATQPFCYQIQEIQNFLTRNGVQIKMIDYTFIETPTISKDLIDLQ